MVNSGLEVSESEGRFNRSVKHHSMVLGFSDATFRSGKIGPVEAERIADLANRIWVEFVARTYQRQFRSSPLPVDRHGSETFSALFVPCIKAAPMFG